MNNRFELTAEDNKEELKEIASVLVKTDEKQVLETPKITGGESIASSSSMNSEDKLLFFEIATAILVIILICDIVFGLRHGCYKQAFKCPCNRR